MNLLGCTVIHKEKQVRKKEHKLKIIPTNADVIVLGLQSKDQAEQWLRVSAAFGTCPAAAPTLLPLPRCKPVYKHTTSMSWDSFFLQLPAAFCARETVEGPPSSAAVAGGSPT